MFELRAPRHKGTLRGKVINDTANNTDQKPVRQRSVQSQLSWPHCNSRYLEKAAKNGDFGSVSNAGDPDRQTVGARTGREVLHNG